MDNREYVVRDKYRQRIKGILWYNRLLLGFI